MLFLLFDDMDGPPSQIADGLNPHLQTIRAGELQSHKAAACNKDATRRRATCMVLWVGRLRVDH